MSRPHGAEDAPSTVIERKRDHLAAAAADVESRTGALWSDVRLMHVAAPEVDLDEIELETCFLGTPLRAPLMISGMTGGPEEAEQLNARLARAAARFGLAIGVGSQRAALTCDVPARSYAIVREQAPDAFVVANIGAAQLISQGPGKSALGATQARKAVEMIDANALAVHLNFLEEMVQPEGDRRARGCLKALRTLIAELGDDAPVIAKETGAGVSPTAALALADSGVAAIDAGGLGGTSFAAIEGMRAAARGDRSQARLGETFREWGVPTAVSVLAAKAAGRPVIATGGVRSGLDAAKALALGADLVGVGRPLLLAALEGEETLHQTIDQFLSELRVALLLTGTRTPDGLQRAPRVVLGELAAWVAQLGLDV